MAGRRRIVASGIGLDEQHGFRVKPGRASGADRGGAGEIRGGWSKGWGGARGAVRMPPANRITSAGRSAGKVAKISGSASQQRVMTKLAYHNMSHAGAHTRYLEREGAGLEQSTAHNHVGYLERDGGGLDHGKAEPFGRREGQEIEAQTKVERWAGAHDRYHWRMVIAPEKSPESLRDMTREVMAKAEAHLGTKLDWFAVEHHGNGNPHVHVVFRGRHEDGKHLYIDPGYVKEGFRHSAQEYVTREHGERSAQEIERGEERAFEIAQEREHGLEHGLERVREYAQEHGLDDKDRLALERTMKRGSVKEIEQTHRKLDALEQVREVEQEVGQERAQELERKVLDGGTRQVAQVERQVEQVQQQVEQRVERVRSRDRGMDMGL